MKRIGLLCFAVIASLAMFASVVSAEVQSIKVSGDIETFAISRDEMDLDGNAGVNNDSLFTTTRLKIDADLTDNVSAAIRLINERDWDSNTGEGEDIELDLAYVTLNEILYSPLSVTIGRQNLRFGSALVVGDPDTNAVDANGALQYAEFSKRKSFDAIRATLDYNPIVVDFIYAKIGDGLGDGAGDEDLWGINAAHAYDAYDAEVEAYLFYNRDDSYATAIGSTTFEENEVWTYGVRGSAVPIDSLTLSAELALQGGHIVNADGGDGNPGAPFQRTRKALAADVAASYALDLEYSPILTVGYSFRSGEENANTGDYEAWDPMFEDQTRGVLADAIFGTNSLGAVEQGLNGGVNSNTHTLNVGASVLPLADVKLAIDYYRYVLDESGAASSTRTTDTHLGDEFDISVVYDYTEDVNLGLFAGWFASGDSFASSNETTATEIFANVSVAF